MMSLYHCFLHVRNLVCVLIFGYMFSTNFHFTLPMPAPEKSVIYVNHSIFDVNHLNFADFFSAGDFADFSGEKVGKKVTQNELFLGNIRKKIRRINQCLLIHSSELWWHWRAPYRAHWWNKKLKYRDPKVIS